MLKNNKLWLPRESNNMDQLWLNNAEWVGYYWTHQKPFEFIYLFGFSTKKGYFSLVKLTS